MEKEEHPEALGAGLLQIGDLGPDLLNAVFLKLGPSPMHLAALPCVCKAWHKLVYEATWKQLCEQRAPAVCKAMGFSAVNAPAGGWQALFKMLTFCPGMSESFRPEPEHPDPGDWGWWDLLGHVQERGSTFQTGLEVNRDLELGVELEQEVVFVTRFCDHKFEGDARNPQGCVARGLVANFPGSLIAERSGVTAYLRSSPEVQQKVRRDNYDEHCVYCSAPMLYLMPEYSASVAADGDQPVAIHAGFCTMVQVCLNGHLRLTGYYTDTSPDAPSSLRPESSSPGDTQIMDVLKVSRVVAKAFAANSWGTGLQLVERLNASTFAKQLKRLAFKAADLEVWEGFLEESAEVLDNMGPLRAVEEVGPFTDLQVLEELEAEWREVECLERIEDMEARSLTSESNEDLDTNLELAVAEPDRAAPFWDLPPSVLDELSRLFREVHKSGAIMRRYLSNKQSACITLEQLRRLRTLGFNIDQLEDARAEMKSRRREEAEAAIQEAGIRPKRYSRGNRSFSSWPDSSSISNYASQWGAGITLDEVIARQRKALENPGSNSRGRGRGRRLIG